ncbi:MAG: class I SAM-dependent methyltransferase [Gammaproteobacteria bacterium]|jgi:ubiquinone/menaquinone biosynthesis C-methylase UbiE
MATRVYDRVAACYDDDWGGIYAAARTCYVEQICRARKNRGQPPDTLDLGVGTGNSLFDLGRRLPLGKCTGFDLSRGMLRQARSKLGDRVELLREDALRAARHMPAASADLVLCHFLLSFVAADPLLDEVYRLLRPGGLFSLATSTQRSLGELHSGRFSRTGRLLGVRRELQKASTPADHRHCLELVRTRGFTIVDEHSQRRQLLFESFADVRDWALNSGWIAGSLDDPFGLRIACATAIFALARLTMHPLYPIEAHSEISIVLARKPRWSEERPRHDHRQAENPV